VDGQLGLERTPEEYVGKMVGVFREVRRVLRDDGTLWLNLGDSYCSGGRGTWRSGASENKGQDVLNDMPRPKQPDGLKPKDLIGLPWRVAFALQADGWTLRSEIVWHKPNPMPESVTDRPTKSHEQVFLFSKARWVGPERGSLAHISDEDGRWLALFLDTEGNICIKRVQREDGRTQYGTQVAFANTNRPLLEAARRIVGSGTVLERPGKNAPMFYYQLSNIEAAALLYRLYPFLIVKSRQAAVGIHVQAMLAPGGKKRPGGFRHPDLTTALESAWASMKALNHFGNPDLSDVPVPEYGRWDSRRYWYDAEAIREPVSPNWEHGAGAPMPELGAHRLQDGARGHQAKRVYDTPKGANARSVWSIATQPFRGAHFAVFPKELARRCILAGCPVGGTVLDPFFGSGTVGVVARQEARHYIGIDLNPEYVEMARQRIESECPMERLL
jgi:DNA modification methylase